ncbi:hypothetical protein P154DRAFT_538064 [Amniculicola lignicola CBS 123094]|uniref:Uncharacterized protein n=1 Tax=Amniculicola lignicola CBS 123094 TaxID=1392246 RepID=A0A6A5W3D9_9PLEO|nr:hypothetical protein P154DRAFT_538064 [Amniculicola lignicola CBS 123094]
MPSKRVRPPGRAKSKDRDVASTPKKPIISQKPTNLTLKLTNRAPPPTQPTINQDNAAPIQTTSTQPSHPAFNLPPTFSSEITRLYNEMSSSLIPTMRLPDLLSPTAPRANDAQKHTPPLTRPWTASHLTHLYLLAHFHRNTSICDLIVDTWIRAFQTLSRRHDRKEEKHPHLKSARLWRKNRDRKAVNSHYMHTTKTHGHPKNDNGKPYLDDTVTAFDSALLNKLYEQTKGDTLNGARWFWADAFALCGKRMAELLEVSPPGTWHPEFVANVAVKALSAVRLRVTFLCEVRWPEEWCKRYHAHGEGSECYRVVCRRVRKAEEEERRKEEEEEGEEEDKRTGKKRKVAFQLAENVDRVGRSVYSDEEDEEEEDKGFGDVMEDIMRGFESGDESEEE